MDATFEGYRRPDGRVGVRNYVAVIPTSVAAAAVATLDELSGGRATLGISAGDPAFLESVGIDQKKPITAVREAIQS